MRYTANISDLSLNILSDKLNYEDIDDYNYEPTFINIVKPLLKDWLIFRDRIFFVCQPKENSPLLKFGWKIHISSTPSNSVSILKKVTEICREHSTSFKFILDNNIRDMSCGKNWSRSASGKFITIYPKSNKEFEILIEQLYKSLKKYNGPYILTDKRYKDCKVVYYRYGTISPDIIRYADGREFHIFTTPSGDQEIDQRQPYYYKPSWVKKPNFEEDENENNMELSLKKGRYIIKNVISFSSTGGVYIAHDSYNEKNVIIKEARPYTLTSIYHKNDAVDNLQNEYKNLLAFQKVDYIPNPIDIFKEWEHQFMVQEYIDYDNLNEFSASQSILLNPKPSKKDILNFNIMIEKIFKNISYGIKEIHDMGYTINDLSPNNIMIDKNTLDIKIIDLEGVTPISSKDTFIMTTPGYAPKSDHMSYNSFSTDLYALGAIMFDVIFSGAIFKKIQENFYERLLERVKSKYQISNKVSFLIKRLTDNSHKINSINEVLDILESNQTYSFERKSLDNNTNIELRDRLLNNLIRTFKKDELKDFLPPLRQNNFNIEHGYFGILHIINYCQNNLLNIKNINKYLNVNILVKELKSPGLYNGKSGVAWSLLELGFIDEAVSVLEIAYTESKQLKNYSLYCGLAGIAYTHLFFYLKLNEDSYLNKAVEIAEIISSKAIKESHEKLYWTDEDSNKHIGYLDGSTGIALFFLYLYKIKKDKEYLNTAKKSLNYDLSFVKSYFNNIKSLAFSDEENITKVSPYLDNGSAGVITVLLRLIKYDLSCEKTYSNYFDDLVLDCQRIYTAYPTFFDGLAGLGNTMLDCYHFTSDIKYKKMALDIADTIKCYEIQINCNESCMPGIHLLRSANDFASGTSGILGFIERLVSEKHNFNFTLDHLL